jgi:hypothetical protein
LIERLILLDKVERGNDQSENAQTVTEVELENEMKKWFK